MEHLFVYGSLAPGEVNAHHMEDIPGEWHPAYVKGHLKKQGWGAHIGFPGIILDDQGEVVQGLLFSSATLSEHWQRLDEFEGEEYERVTTRVTVRDRGEVEAFVYALRRM